MRFGALGRSMSVLLVPLCAATARGQELPEPEVAWRLGAGLGYSYGGQVGLTYEYANRIVAGVAGLGLTGGRVGAVIGARVYRDTGRRAFLQLLYGPIRRLRDERGGDAGSFDGVMLDAGWSQRLDTNLRLVTSIGVGLNPAMRDSPVGRAYVFNASVGVSWSPEAWVRTR
jgi:hypothetical protein